MLQLVRNNSPYTAILLFIFTLCLHLQSLMHAVLPQATEGQLLYANLLHVLSFALGKSAFAFSFLATVLIYIQALFLNMIAVRHRLFQSNTYLVAFAFIAISSVHPALGQFNPMLVLNFFVLFALNELLQLKQAVRANKHLFNIGFAMMLAIMMQFSALFLLVFLFAALLILRPFSFREWMITIVGLIMPLYMWLVLLFCTDKLKLVSFWPDLGLSLPSQLKPAHYWLGLIVGIMVWGAISLYNMQSQLPKAAIYIRRCWMTLTIWLLASLVAAIFSDNHIKAVWMICLPATGLVLAHAFGNERSKKMNAISFYFALAFVIFCQIFLPI